jgi:hypothetical protein
MGNILTIARHTLAESIRQKTAMFLLAILGVLIGILPFATRGDNSLSGAVQSFLSYSVSLVGFVLSCVTIFLSKSISDDLTGKQIMMLMVKPIARWQYVLGKWAGIVTLNLSILALCGGMIYGMTMYLAGQRRGFVVAAGVLVLVAGLLMRLALRRVSLRAFFKGPWKSTVVLLALIIAPTGWSIQSLYQHLGARQPRDEYDAERLQNQVLQARYASKFKMPLDDLRAMANQQFERGIEDGTYVESQSLNKQAIKDKLYTDLVSRWRTVIPRKARPFEFEDIRCDRDPEKLIHISYRLRVYNYPPDEILRCYWIVGDRTKGARQVQVPRRDVIDRRHTLAVPSDCVAPDGTLAAVFVNENPWIAMGEKQANNLVSFEGDNAVEVLFSVSSFGSNLIRALALVAFRLMFLAAIAVLLTALFSFPVACLAALVAYFVAATPTFLAEALDWMPDEGAASIFTLLMQYLLWGLHAVLLPKFSDWDGLELLVEGRNVTLMWVMMGFGRLVLIQAGALLLATCLLFRRREVAEVSI